MNGATFCTFTYLAPLVTEVTGFGPGWVPVVLALFGIGSFAGVSLAGRVADVRPLPLLVGGAGALLVALPLFAVTAAHPAAVLVLVLVLGALSFGVGATLIGQVLHAAAEAPTLAGGFATAAFNVGGALGPLVRRPRPLRGVRPPRTALGQHAPGRPRAGRRGRGAPDPPPGAGSRRGPAGRPARNDPSSRGPLRAPAVPSFRGSGRCARTPARP
ncbi:sugar efflux transporter [Streptomyces alboniger]